MAWLNVVVSGDLCVPNIGVCTSDEHNYSDVTIDLPESSGAMTEGSGRSEARPEIAKKMTLCADISIARLRRSRQTYNNPMASDLGLLMQKNFRNKQFASCKTLKHLAVEGASLNPPVECPPGIPSCRDAKTWVRLQPLCWCPARRRPASAGPKALHRHV